MNRRQWIRTASGLVVAAAAGVRPDPEYIQRFFALDRTMLGNTLTRHDPTIHFKQVEGVGWVTDRTIYLTSPDELTTGANLDVVLRLWLTERPYTQESSTIFAKVTSEALCQTS